VADKVEAREKQTDTGIKVSHTHDEATITKGNDEIHVDSHVFVLHRMAEATASEVSSEDFTRDAFENALDKVSRPLKGRFAHVPYSSDDLIRDKKAETELEDRES
jgi:hypothetical protein